MTTKVKINRLATGVPGLDEVLGGGLPEFSFNLIAGPPGCGKTTLAHQIMFALATPAAAGAVFHGAGRAAAEDAALPAAVRFLRQRRRSTARSASSTSPTRSAAATSTRCCAASPPKSRRTGRRWSSSTRSARWCCPSAGRRQRAQRAAAVHPAARHADDELAGHHLPDRRILRRDRCRTRSSPWPTG